MKTKIFINIFLFMFISGCKTPDTTIPTLTNEQMQEDISFLVRAIKEIEPNIAIREQVTGTPIMAEIDSLAVIAKDLRTFEDFYYLAQRILLLCQDQHENLQGFYPQGIEDSNHYISQEAIKISELCETRYDWYNPQGCSPFFKYIDGKYYFFVDIYRRDNDKQYSLLIPSGSQLLAINNISINEYVNEWGRKIDNSIRWDNARKKYYTYRIYHPMITLQDTNESFVTCNINGVIKTITMRDWSISTNTPTGVSDEKVFYFDTSDILYVRIPDMDYEKIEYYKTEILRYANKPIKKVIIDIRRNGGGSDYVWMDVLSSIIDKPLITPSKVYRKNTPLSIDYATNIRKDKISSYTQDKVFFRTSDNYDTILPAKQNIHYSGKIYVLVNEYCFSSSLAFISFCERTDRLVTVGKNTGYVKGRSTTPYFLTLPNSKLIFELIPSLDMTNITRPEDHYDNAAEIPIEPSIEYYINEITYEGNRYDKDFLFNYDPIFKAALEAK
jgi:hypothetical protein